MTEITYFIPIESLVILTISCIFFLNGEAEGQQQVSKKEAELPVTKPIRNRFSMGGMIYSYDAY